MVRINEEIVKFEYTVCSHILYTTFEKKLELFGTMDDFISF